MVDIVNGSVRVNQLNEILDNLNNIVFGQHTRIHIGVQAQFLVDAVASYFAQVVSLVREEKVLEYFPCTGIIGGIGIAELTIDVQHSLFFRVAGVFGQRVEDDRELVGCIGILVK